MELTTITTFALLIFIIVLAIIAFKLHRSMIGSRDYQLETLKKKRELQTEKQNSPIKYWTIKIVLWIITVIAWIWTLGSLAQYCLGLDSHNHPLY